MANSRILNVRHVVAALLVGILVTGASSTHAPAATAFDFVITPNSMGRLALGDDLETIRHRYKDAHIKQRTVLDEGDLPQRLVEIWAARDLLLTAELDPSGRVYRITTERSEFRTSRGIGVGSSLADVTREYGKPVFGTGDAGYFAAVRFVDGTLSFRLQLTPPWPESPPTDSRIDLILVVARVR